MSFFRRHSGKRGKETSSSSKGSNTLPKSKTTSPRSVAVTGSKTLDNINGNIASEPARLPNTYDSVPRTDSGLLLLQDEYCPGDLGVSSGSLHACMNKSSRLSKCLDDMIKDHEAIPHLIQYMESCKASALIRFWLDAESFQASTWTRIRSHSLNTVSKSSLVKERESSMKKSKSINQDITSPVSMMSEDSAYLETKTNSTEALSSSCDSNPLPVNGDEEFSEFQTGPLCNQSGAGEDKNKDSPPVKTNSTSSCPGNDGKSYSSDCDQRTRDKCKIDQEKMEFNLPLKSCDNTVNEMKNVNKDSESAISYRDIASPSPTIPDNDGPQVLTKPTSSPGFGSASKDSLAEKLKKSVEQDAVRIFTKYLAQEATHPISITDDLRNETIRKICREDGQVDPECFVDCQKFVLARIDARYFDGFKLSVFQCKYQVEVLTGGQVHLTDVLYNETALFYFMEYMEQEHLCHLLHFVIATDNFEQLLASQETYDGLQAQGDAMVLYDKYFSLQAAQPLGFPDTIRFEVEGNICREEGPLPDCFSKPRLIVLHTIEKLHFPRYLTSDVYYKYLSELVSTVQTAQDFPLGQRRRRGSETSSEHSVGGSSVGGQSIGSESISSKNTLLATGNPRRIQLNTLDENMRNIALDPGLLNPDSLWERPIAGNMSLGKIDILGQFVSDFVPDPDLTVTTDKKKGTSGGSRFFKSKKDKEREQEEMARKVAEMILKDVTSVTQAISAIKNPVQSDSGGNTG